VKDVLRRGRQPFNRGREPADTGGVRVDELEHWLGLEGYTRRRGTGQAALDQGTAAALDCPLCGHSGLRLLALERHRDHSYRAVAWCPRRGCHEAVEI
jgi:hypothetical protein